MAADTERPRTDIKRRPVRFDATDLEILKYLVSDARQSQRAVARAVGMSPPTVADRISRLEAAGVITGYSAKINYAALGRMMTVVVGVVSDRSSTQLDFAMQLTKIPEVERIDVVTGDSDLLVRIRVRDQDHLNEVLFDTLLRGSAEIRHIHTSLALVTVEPENFAKQLLDELTVELEQGRSPQDSPGSYSAGDS